ncbi:Uncharacterised protein [Staphylococcus epidermidis]|uniref:hypothetical protein n=1 Tax=Staphylococcus epidermidis TaxID=1282 RepID=UPI000E002BBE|nr:hypothetical protein [Staphylococcus epidermidis]SUM53519.1 Uncharacterised protein [Staphylococcus epidermidis]SUM53520.1 Uncharacterised protein [Staphylococcus epidermidis]
MVSNLEKFKRIESIMTEVQGEMKAYLKVLLERHEYMNTYRKEYKKLKRTVSDIKSEMRSVESVNDEISTLIKSARTKIERNIEELKKEREIDLEGGYDVAIKSLNDINVLLEGSPKLDKIEEAKVLLQKNKIEIPEINVLLEDYEKELSGSNKEDIKSSVIKLLDSADSEYLDSFKGYREACEESEDVYESFSDIVDVLLELGFISKAEELTEALPDIEETRRTRPNPEPLLNMLIPVKSGGLQYFPSRNRQSESYDLNRAFAKEVAYVRRALLEDREYIGTKNAFDRVNKAFEDLSEYMYERFYQLGGTPKNYHGHDDR